MIPLVSPRKYHFVRSLFSFLFVFAIIACSTQPVVDTSSPSVQKQPSKTDSTFNISGNWYAVHLQQMEISDEVCMQRSYQLRIDSLGVVYRMGSDTRNLERMGWLEPVPASIEGYAGMEIRRFKTGEDLRKFRFRKISADHFHLERSLHFPVDKHYQPDPIADPVTYPDGTEKPAPKRCDTEVWKFRRMAEE